ncbi:MAG: outer membrane protein assembly factor BamB family protein [Pirellulales bacterium]
MFLAFRTLFLFAFCAILSSVNIDICSAQDWTRFRGPNGSGISEATTVPTKWTDDQYNWKVDLPGEGHSSPVIWKDRIFLTSADSQDLTRHLLCLSTKDGSVLWQQKSSFSKYKVHKINTYASNSLAVDDKFVYVLWQTREESSISALTHDGLPVWSIPLGDYKSGHGTGSSPIVFNDTVIIGNDHDGSSSFLLALDRNTGKEKWKVPRLSDRACYSTPCVFEQKGRRTEIIFTHSFRGITGIDAESGNVNWEIDVFGRHAQRAVGSPVIYKDMVIGSSGFTTAEKNVVIVKPTGSGKQSSVEEVYRLFKSVPHIPTPLVHQDLLYLITDTGILSAYEADSGNTVWQKRLGGNFFSSPICINGYLYCTDVDGKVSVLKTGDEFELVSEQDLGEDTRSTPAVSGGVLYLRTRSTLFSLGG